ncbi:MAG: MFS transporter [Clostridia bacterium]|nr:MFS transporter [Clostridia bacterium]
MAKKPIQYDENGYRKFGMRDKISYAAGDLGCNMSFALKSSIMAIFWMQFMLIGEELYATLLLVVQIWDAINDPLLGALFDADRRNYKQGKFKTYIFIGAVGLVFSGLFFFLPIPNADTWIKAIIFVLGYVLWDACYTVANVPYGSMMNVITENGSERSQLSTWRSIGSMVGNIIPMVILPMIVYVDNELDGIRVFIAALIMGVIGLGCFIFMLKTATIRVDEQVVKISEPKQKFNVIKAMGNFVKNRAAVGATIAAMAMFIGMQGSSTATAVLFQSYFKNASISGVMMLISYLPMFFFMPFIKKIVDKFGKKEACVVGSGISMLGGILLFILPITPNTLGMIMYVVAQLFFGFGLGFYTCVSWALMADAIDYNEWKTGNKEEGTVYSLHSFFRKLAQGLGPSLVVLIMAALGYDSELGSEQTIEVATNMRWLVAGLYAFAGIAMFLSITFIYNLDKKKVAEMTADLQARRAVVADEAVAEVAAEEVVADAE